MASGTPYIVAKAGSFLYSPRKTRTDYEDRNKVWNGERWERSVWTIGRETRAGRLEDQAACPAAPKVIQNPGELSGIREHSRHWVALPGDHL